MRSRPWHICSLLAGCAGLLGLVVGLTTLDAQEKGGPKTKEGKVDPKKEGKIDPKKPKVPEVRDVLVFAGGGVENIQLINETMEAAWAENSITPSERASDFEFIRRASLDIIGRIAKVHEIERFLKDPPERRRSMLIERLLGLEKGPDQHVYAEEYADNWASIWTTLLLTRSGTAKLYQEQMRDWLRSNLIEAKTSSKIEDLKSTKEDGKKPAKEESRKSDQPDWSQIVTEILTAEGATNENGAVTYILAHLGDAVPPADAKGKYGSFDMVPLTSRTTKLFLGQRTQCVQCHDHMFIDDRGQHLFWGINAFFRQVDAPRGRLMGMMGKGGKKDGAPQRELKDNTALNVGGLIPYERRTGVFLFTDATFLDGKKMKLKGDSTRRKELAKLITKDPDFAKAYVNRVWAHFFGKGFTKDAIDDFGEHNPVTAPYAELFNKLCDDWANKYQHNPKVLMRWICNSRAYGLSSAANKGNDKAEDEIFFARMLQKAMTPEQLFESLMTATDAKVGQNKESRIALREEWLNRLIVNFGDDEGNEGTYNGTVVQALLLMNGEDINKAITDKDNGTVAVVLKKRAFSQTAAKDAMKDLFLAALNRPPRTEEYTKIINPKMFLLPRDPGATKDAAAFWTNFYQDLFWAVLNSNEFILNH